MAETTCLMQQPFSHPSDNFHEPQQANPICALGESVSFGRYMTESLAWEKWSSFNHNRYLEEVEKYSKPGSVAQKKAYFEEHYKKKLAAKKAEKEVISVINGACDNGCRDVGGSNCHASTEESGEVEREVEASTCGGAIPFDGEEHEFNGETVGLESTEVEREVELPTSGDATRFDCEEHDFSGETVGLESIEVEVKPLEENLVLCGISMSPDQHGDIGIKVTNEVEMVTVPPPSEKLPLKEIPYANKQSLAPKRKMKPGSVSLKASGYNRESKLPFSPARPRTPLNLRKEHSPSLSSKKTKKESLDRTRPTPNCHANTEESSQVERKVEVSISEEATSFGGEKGNFIGETVGLESIDVEVDPVKENDVLVESSELPGSANLHEDVEIRMINEVETDITLLSENLPLKEIPSANQQSLATKRKLKPGCSSSLNKDSKLPLAPARPRTPVNPRKENNPSLSSKKTTKESLDGRRPTSLHMSLNFTSFRGNDSNKTATRVSQNSKDSRISVSSTRAPNDCSRSLRLPARASGNGVPKPPPLPISDSRRTKIPVEHSQHKHGNRTSDMKWKSLSVDHSKSSSTFEDKSCSTSISSSFTLKSEQRAAKRKEYFQKLQDEQNAKEAQKLQLEAQSKEKAENELRKLRQNLGFKAKPMPDFYREPQLPKTPLKKIPLTRPRSPKLGRKHCSSPVRETGALPPKQAMERSSRTPNSKKNAHENASPNIQT